MKEVKKFIVKLLKSMHLSFQTENGATKEEIIEGLWSYILDAEGTQEDNPTNKVIEYAAVASYIEGFLLNNPEIMVIQDEGKADDSEPLSRNVEDESGPSNAENELEEQLRISIEQYDEVIKTQQAQGKDIKTASDLKAMLIKQLEEIKNERKGGSGKKEEEKKRTIMRSSTILNPDEIKDKALKEIFSFYCRQQLLIGKKATFEVLHNVITNMNLGEFMKFCKDFAIPVSATKIKELFKKTAKLSKELDYDLFLVSSIIFNHVGDTEKIGSRNY